VGLLQQKVYKTRITELKKFETATENSVSQLDHVLIAAAIRQWHRQWHQISDAYFVCFLLQYFPHVVINWIQIWRIWRPQVKVG